jgi:hypothetical protein
MIIIEFIFSGYNCSSNIKYFNKVLLRLTGDDMFLWSDSIKMGQKWLMQVQYTCQGDAKTRPH